MSLRPALLLSLCLGLGACIGSSPKPLFLQLSAGTVEPGSSSTPRVQIGPVRLPDYLLRAELLRRKGEYEVLYDRRFRWAEPLDLGVQRVLAHRLSASLGSFDVVSYPHVPTGGVDWIIDVRLRRFEASDNKVIIVADARLTQRATEQVQTLRFEEAKTLHGRGGADIAAAMSDLLAAFARSLEERIRSTG